MESQTPEISSQTPLLTPTSSPRSRTNEILLPGYLLNELYGLTSQEIIQYFKDDAEGRSVPSQKELSLRLRYLPLETNDVDSNPERLCGGLEVIDITKEPDTLFKWPLAGIILQYFHLLHSGIDIADVTNPMGGPVLAVTRGVVIDIQEQSWGYGNYVVLNHENKLLTLYAHLSEINVQIGEEVQEDTILGRVGSTGYSSGFHLHLGVFERSEDGCIAVNPLLLLP
ncbi:MAG: M23 family metallopeptidase [Candidatus Daviesbacteria bacterium]|nr:M23 family metallopeptidase [Candidatus Daviesbacteria bacterium]